jgi:hypothetical protein
MVVETETIAEIGLCPQPRLPSETSAFVSYTIIESPTQVAGLHCGVDDTPFPANNSDLTAKTQNVRSPKKHDGNDEKNEADKVLDPMELLLLVVRGESFPASMAQNDSSLEIPPRSRYVTRRVPSQTHEPSRRRSVDPTSQAQQRHNRSKSRNKDVPSKQASGNKEASRPPMHRVCDPRSRSQDHADRERRQQERKRERVRSRSTDGQQNHESISLSSQKLRSGRKPMVHRSRANHPALDSSNIHDSCRTSISSKSSVPSPSVTSMPTLMSPLSDYRYKTGADDKTSTPQASTSQSTGNDTQTSPSRISTVPSPCIDDNAQLDMYTDVLEPTAPSPEAFESQVIPLASQTKTNGNRLLSPTLKKLASRVVQTSRIIRFMKSASGSKNNELWSALNENSNSACWDLQDISDEIAKAPLPVGRDGLEPFSSPNPRLDVNLQDAKVYPSSLSSTLESNAQTESAPSRQQQFAIEDPEGQQLNRSRSKLNHRSRSRSHPSRPARHTSSAPPRNPSEGNAPSDKLNDYDFSSPSRRPLGRKTRWDKHADHDISSAPSTPLGRKSGLHKQKDHDTASAPSTPLGRKSRPDKHRDHARRRCQSSDKQQGKPPGIEVHSSKRYPRPIRARSLSMPGAVSIRSSPSRQGRKSTKDSLISPLVSSAYVVADHASQKTENNTRQPTSLHRAGNKTRVHRDRTFLSPPGIRSGSITQRRENMRKVRSARALQDGIQSLDVSFNDEGNRLQRTADTVGAVLSTGSVRRRSSLTAISADNPHQNTSGPSMGSFKPHKNNAYSVQSCSETKRDSISDQIVEVSLEELVQRPG